MRFGYMRWLLLVSVLLMTGIQSWGQTRPFDQTFQDEYSENFEEETTIDPDSIDYEAYTKKTSSFKAIFSGKPGKAIMYGLMIPGGGQLYNRRYWKFPLAIAAEATTIYLFYDYRTTYFQLRNAYAARLEDPDVVLDMFNNFTNQQLDTYRKAFQKRSEQAGIGILAVHVLVAVEAYIDRHLKDFDINEDLSFDFNPTIPVDFGLPVSGLTLTYAF